MPNPDHPAASSASPPAVAGDFGPTRPWEACVLPIVVFLAGGLVEPLPEGGGLAGLLGIPMAAYPLIYSVRIAAPLLALAIVRRPIRDWVGRPAWWAVPAGLLLVVPWLILAGMQRDAGWSVGGTRAAFDPFTHFAGRPAAAWTFLAVRAVGLVAVVPLVEELFLRGFLMRTVIREDFWAVPFGTLTAASAATCAVYAAATHPAEAVAAVGWFAVVSGIAAATRRPSDTILVHAATNLALGAYVLATGSWWLL
jgi:hypothetical protein